MDPLTALLGMSLISGLFGGLGSGVSSAEARKQRKFASREAEKQRTWMEQMSNTAHQREVADLRSAGLNPILSSGGSGASVSGGASASAPSVPDTSQKILDSGLAIGNAIMSAVSLQKDIKLAESQQMLNDLQGKSVLADIAYKNQLTRRQNMENNLYPKFAQEQLLGMMQNRHASAENIKRQIESFGLQQYDVRSKHENERRRLDFEERRHNDLMLQQEKSRTQEQAISQAYLDSASRGQDLSFASALLNSALSLAIPVSTPGKGYGRR